MIYFKNTMKILILTLLLPQDYKSVMTRVKQQFTERTVTTIFFRGTVINRTIAFTHPAEKWSTLAFIWSRFWPNYWLVLVGMFFCVLFVTNDHKKGHLRQSWVIHGTVDYSELFKSKLKCTNKTKTVKIGDVWSKNCKIEVQVGV